jgi:glycosyltransferase involved in cell wall biosynthesis
LSRLFIISINYAPEPTGFAPHAAALAAFLAARGHDVSVFTGFPFAPEWKRRAEDRGQFVRTERNEQVTVHRLTHFIPRRPSSALQRILMESTFSLLALPAVIAAALRGGRPDALLYIGAQPALAMLTRIIAALFGRPYFVNVNDLAARAALDVGIVAGPLYRLLDTFEFAAYRGAAGASVLCRAFEDALIEHGYPADRIRLIRSPIDIEQIRPVADDGSFRRRYGIPPDARVILHAGSMGKKQGLMNVVDAAAAGGNNQVLWVFVGGGEDKAMLVDAVKRRRLDERVRFVPFQRDEEVAAMFAAADVLLLNQLRTVKDTVIPSKLLTYMSAGRPVMAAVNASSQGAEILRDADGGRLVTPEDPQALAAAAAWFMALPPEQLKAYGARNRAYAEAHFDQRTILAAHEDFMFGARVRRCDGAAVRGRGGAA